MRIWLLLILKLTLAVAPAMAATANARAPKGACLVCHKLRTPELYQAWLGSAHARNNVTCLDCHEAAPGEPDAFAHGGSTVSVLVTPKDCAGCHAVESGDYTTSVHAAAAVNSQQAGSWGEASTCKKCHGGLALGDSGTRNKLKADAWPDRGTGRVNPDGSRGSCSACHTDHAFKIRLAGEDKSCKSCHTKGHQAHHGASGGPGGPALDNSRSCLSCHEKHGHGASPKALRR